jgi:thiol-disulfide isomerase/thioredoxin
VRFSVVWWHKLIKYWTKLDGMIFVAFNWFLIFGFSVLIMLVQAKPLNLPFTAAFSFIMVPVSFFITYAFQNYSSNSEEINSYPALLPNDFNEDKLLRKEKILAFFYAEWCPFCRRTFSFLKHLKPDSSYRIFRVDLSDEDNPLWTSFNIEVVLTLIAFDDGKEFWRANGVLMVGLKKRDFEKADTVMKATKTY